MEGASAVPPRTTTTPNKLLQAAGHRTDSPPAAVGVLEIVRHLASMARGPARARGDPSQALEPAPHAVEVVDRGFMQLFGVAAHAGKLLLLLLWALSTSVLVFPPLIIVLVAMVLRMRARERNATLLRLKNFKTYDMVMMHAENVTSNFELVRRQAETALSVVAQLFRSSAPLAGSICSRRLSTLQRNQVTRRAL